MQYVRRTLAGGPAFRWQTTQWVPHPSRLLAKGGWQTDRTMGFAFHAAWVRNEIFPQLLTEQPNQWQVRHRTTAPRCKTTISAPVSGLDRMVCPLPRSRLVGP